MNTLLGCYIKNILTNTKNKRLIIGICSTYEMNNWRVEQIIIWIKSLGQVMDKLGYTFDCMKINRGTCLVKKNIEKYTI